MACVLFKVESIVDTTKWCKLILMYYIQYNVSQRVIWLFDLSPGSQSLEVQLSITWSRNSIWQVQMAKIARNGTSLAVWQLQIHLPMQESLVRSLGWEDPLEEEMATHSSILVWNTPRTEEPGGLQSMGLQRLGHDLVTKQQQKILKKPNPRKTPKRLQQKGDVLVQALGKSRNCPGVHDANDVARTQRFQPHSPPRGGWFPHTVDMGCTEHSSTCPTEIDDPLYLRRLSQGDSRGS